MFDKPLPAPVLDLLAKMVNGEPIDDSLRKWLPWCANEGLVREGYDEELGYEYHEVTEPGRWALEHQQTQQVTEAEQWLRQAEVARGLDFGRNGRQYVNQLLDRGELVDNGRPGIERRVSLSSVLLYCTKAGITWNPQRTSRPKRKRGVNK